MHMHKTFFRVMAAALLFAAAGQNTPALAAAVKPPTDAEVASRMAGMLGREFEPDSVSVTVLDSHAYAEMKGCEISGIRIDTMRLEALLTNRGESVKSDDAKALATMIGFSRGEIILTEKDVNGYFAGNDIRGFSGLRFDFSPQGFKASGVFSAKFLMTIRIQLAAHGVLALRPDGVYLDKVAIYVENMKQPDILTRQIVAHVNPLLEWSDIPFKVEFKTVAMDDSAARMSGNPKRFEGGSTSEWKKGQGN